MSYSRFFVGLMLICWISISYGQSHFLPIKQGSKWGYIDENGSIKIKAQFNAASDFKNGAAKVFKDGHAYLIDTFGRQISQHGIDDFLHVDSLIIYNKENKMGICSYSGKSIAEPIYSSIVQTPISGIYQVAQDNLFGLINSDGKIVAPIESAGITYSANAFWCFTGVKNYYNFYIPLFDQWIEGRLTNIRVVNDHVFVQSSKKWKISGTLDTLNNTGWDDIVQISESYILGISKNDTSIYYGKDFSNVGSNLGFVESSLQSRLVVNKDDKCFIIKNGLVNDVPYDFVKLNPNKEYYVVQDGFANYLDSNLIPIYKWKYSAIEPIELGYAKIYNSQGVGLMNRVTQQEILSPRFVSLNLYSSRIKAYSKSNSLWLYSLEDGQISDSIEFSNFGSVRSNSVSISSRADILNPNDTGQVVTGRWYIINKVWGLKDRAGKILIKPQFSSFERISGTPYTIVTKSSYNANTGSLLKNRLGLVNEESGKLIITPHCTYFDKDMLSDNKYSVVRVRTEHGAFNLYDKRTGKSKRLLSPFIDEYVNGRARIYLKGKLSYTEPPNIPCIGYAQDFTKKYGYSLGTDYVRLQRHVLSKYKIGKLQVYAVGGQWNYLDENGNLLLPVYKYDLSKLTHATSFDPVNAIVYRKGFCALVNRNGDQLTGFIYKSIVKTTDGDSSAYKVSKVSSSYNYYNKNGSKIGNVFEYGSDLNNGAAWVKMDKEFHILTEAGNIIKPEEMGIPFRHKFTDGTSPVQVNRNWTVVDTSGSFLFEPRKGKIIWSSEGFSAIRDKVKLKNGRTIRGYAILDTDGVQVGTSLYSRVYPYKNNLAVVRLQNRKFGFIDTDGNLIHSRRYSRMSSFDKNGLVVVRKKGKGVLNKEGKTVVNISFSKIIISDSCIIASVGKRISIFNFDGQKLSTIRNVDRFSKFENGLAMIRKKNKVGYINQKGQWVIQPNYKSGTGFENNTALVRRDDNQYIIDQDENILSVYPGKERMQYSEGILIRNSSLGYRFYNKYGKLLSPKYYSKARVFENGYAKVMSNNKWGVIDRTGKEILPCEFEVIRINEFGEISARKSISYGLIDSGGKDIVTPTYDKIEMDSEINVYKLQYGVVPSYLSKSGNWLWQ